MMWDGVLGDNIWHVYPENDTYPHTIDRMCMCNPTIKQEDHAIIVLHNSFDGREAVEMAKEILGL